MATIFIDNKPYTVKDGDNLLHACLSLGFDIPYFCWHPAMHSVGSCRQCAVKQFKDESDTRGKIVMSCMTPAAEGTRISIDDPEVRAFRASVIEWLMLNHPHDCPVCDEGGECHLQDMTVLTGHTYRRNRFAKRTYHNQYLGPFVNHEMNRCIQCYRCVRFYRDYAGGRDFHVFAAHHHVYFGRHDDGVLQNEFSGNLVEVCPTGVFTDRTFKKHYARKWDLQTAPSVCVHCGIGCNTIPGERYGKIVRIQNRFNGEVNGYFLCDRGRYGYEFVNSEERIRRPWIKREGNSKAAVTIEEALQHLLRLLYFGAKVIGIGSPRASLEANFTLHALVGPEHFFSGLSNKSLDLVTMMADILRKGPARSPSLRDVAQSDAVFVLGEDVTNTSPMLALALRQAVRQRPMAIAKKMHIPQWNDTAVREAMQSEKGPLFIASPYATKLEEVSVSAYHAAPDEIARLGFSVAHELNPDAPAIADLSADLKALAVEIANALKSAERPLIVSGAGCGSKAVIQAAANIASALSADGRTSSLCFTMAECNTLGMGLMGGGSLEDAMAKVYEGKADTAIILENDLFRRLDEASVEKFFNECKHVMVIDHLQNNTTSRAGVVLSCSTFAESGGTLVNNEGRAQRFFPIRVPDADVMESWRWLLSMLSMTGRPEARQWIRIDDITAALSAAYPVFERVKEAAPRSDFRVSGKKIPRQPHRYSGRTALTADVSVHEPKPPGDDDSPFSFSMEGYEGIPPSALIPRFWVPGWNSVQSVNKFQQEVGGPLIGGDPGQRLIEPPEGAAGNYFRDTPGVFLPREGEWLLLPLYHIFGSEELSLHADGISSLSPRPYLALNTGDATKLGLGEGDEVEFSLYRGPVRALPLRIVSSLPDGVAGIPLGLPGLAGIDLPSAVRIVPVRKGSG
jgi:NADH-quinone oxidoreductase subunit G